MAVDTMSFSPRVQLHLLATTLLISTSLTGCGAAQSPSEARQSTAEFSPPSKAAATTEFRASGEDWLQFLGPNGDGTSNETGLSRSNWKPRPPINWVVELGTSYGAPSIAGNQVLQFDRAGSDEVLTSFDSVTSNVIWRASQTVAYSDRYGYNNGPRCSPVVSDGLVFTYGVSGQLTCTDLSDGEIKWTKNLNDEFGVIQNFFGVASNPVVYEDLLLVMVGGSPPESRQYSTGNLDQVKPNGSGVVAFDKRTGKERYRLGNDLASYASLTVRDVAGKSTGLAFLRSGLIGFDPRNGAESFQFPWRAKAFESVNAALPVVVENQILLSECYEIGSVLINASEQAPEVIWQDGGRLRDLSFRAHWSTPIVIDGYIYGCSGRNPPDSDFRCVRLRDGKVMWTNRNRQRGRSSIVQVDGHLIVLGESGLLELVEPNPEEFRLLVQADLSEINNAQTGKPLLRYPCWAAPVVAHGNLYLRGPEHLISLKLLEQ
ncbi:MAG: PQQ-binding-like beta-propeller repeat protein [Planctomycetota bacterium]